MNSTMTRRNFVAGTATAAAAAVAASAITAETAQATTGTPAPGDIPAWLGEEPADGDIANTLETDVLIVGAGNGGMAAAATASDAGVDFLVAEQFDTVQDTRHWIGAVNSTYTAEAGAEVDVARLQYELARYASFFLVAEQFDTVQDTRHWIGAVNSTYTAEAGAEVDVARLQYELARYASFKCDMDLQRMWIDESAEMVEWIAGIYEPAGGHCVCDADMGPDMDPANTTGNYVGPIQHMFYDADGSRNGIPARNELLQSYIEEAGNGDKLLWNHTLLKLVHTDGKVTGAIFETDDGNVQINAKIVILATGGYPANADMVNALAPIIPQCVTAVSYSPKDRGEGIKAAIWAGAVKDTEAAPMIFNRGAVLPGVDCGYVDGQFPGTIGQLNYGSQPFMKVNRDGKRFFNESSPYDFNCFAASLQKGGVWCSVFDANMVEDIMRFHCDGCAKITAQQLSSGKPIDEVYAKYLEDGIMIKADTIEELADKLGFDCDGCAKITAQQLSSGKPIDEVYAKYLEDGIMIKADTIEELADKLGFEGDAEDAFLAQVDQYNQYYDNQLDEQFHKEAYRLSAIRTAPFYGTWFGGSLLTTCDGVRINAECQADNQLDEQFHKEAYRLSAIRTAPFYGTWFGGSLLTTCDGVRINAECQALDADCNVIDGLYVIGDCSGSYFSGNYPEYVIGAALGRTLTQGRHVVRKFAGEL